MVHPCKPPPVDNTSIGWDRFRQRPHDSGLRSVLDGTARDAEATGIVYA